MPRRVYKIPNIRPIMPSIRPVITFPFPSPIVQRYFLTFPSAIPLNIIPRKENKNVVILSEKEYKGLEKARNNAAYLARLDLADEQIRQGKVVEKTMEELEAMATE